ncbi:MAG: hypothetical protein MI861_04615 [Pirellulales bacterium]|nr:hypothetical protein [Pirellulales bacterium]
MNQVFQTSSACFVLLLLAQATVQGADENPVAEDSQAKPGQLSVPPLDHIIYPEDRPEWVDARPSLDELPHTWVVISGPSETPEQSVNDLKLVQRAAVETYLKGLPGADGRSDFFPITDQWIEDELAVRRYSGELTQGGDKRYEDAVELRFDQSTRQQMLTALKNVEVRNRLGALGVLVSSGLVGLMCSSAFFGFWSRRVERRDAAKSAA